jgi:hypothetical protein
MCLKIVHTTLNKCIGKMITHRPLGEFSLNICSRGAVALMMESILRIGKGKRPSLGAKHLNLLGG